MSFGAFRRAGSLLLTLCALAASGLPASASAEPRFGDSTWVAPAMHGTAGPEDPGPRVAKPDHERMWESVLRAPFRVAFFPVKLLARGIEATGPIVERHVPHGAVTRVQEEKRGLAFSPELIGATITAKQFVGPGSRLALTGTWDPSGNRRLKFRGYVGERVAPVVFGFDALYDYRPSRRFFGIGNFSDSRTTFFQRRVDLADVYAFVGHNPQRRVRGTLGISDARVQRGSGVSPRSADVFDSTDVPFLTRGSKVWWYGASADFGVLNDSLMPSSGISIKPDVRRYKSSDGGNLSYDQWRLEARGYLPVFASRRVLAARLVYMGVDLRDGSEPIPFYRLPESIDENRFAAYPSGRFRDQRLAMGRAEYRWEIEQPVWAFLMGELGEVASTTSRLSLRSAHPSLGGGFRANVGQSTGRFQIARGHEGLNLKLDLEAMF